MADDITKTDNVRLDLSGERQQQRAGRMDVLAHDADEIRRAQQAGEAWYRTQKKLTDQHKSFTEQLLEEIKATKGVVGELENMQNMALGYIRTLGQLTSVSTIYNNTLEDMRKGQVAFTGSIQATTDSISTASRQSQNYIDGVREAYGNAQKLAREFKIEVGTVQQATDTLNETFATQIQAMGAVDTGLKNMQRDAVIFSRYLGTEMNDVIEMWGERMQQTNKTMKEVQNETALLAGESDKYSKALQKLGKRMLQTGTIGRKQFLSMIREVGQAMQTGTFNAVAYAKALRGLIVEAKATYRTQQEQLKAAQALKEISTGFGEGEGPFAIFGFQAAMSISEKLDDLSWVKDEQTRNRLAQVQKETEGQEGGYVQLEMIRNALQGTPELMAESFRKMRETGMDVNTMSAIIASQTGANMWQSRTIAKQIESDEIASAMQSVQDLESAKEQQRADQLRASVNDLVKQGAKPAATQYKIADMLEKFKGTVEGWIRENPIKAILTRMAVATAAEAAQAATIGFLINRNTVAITAAITARCGALQGPGLPGMPGAGNVPGAGGRFGWLKRLTGGLGQMAGGIAMGYFLPQLLGMGGASDSTKMALSGLGGMGASMLSIPAQIALAGGLVAGRGLDKFGGEMLYSADDERVLGGDKSLSGQISKWALDDADQEEITRIRSGELAQKKKLLKLLNRQIADFDKDHRLSDATRAFKTAALREQRNSLRRQLKHRIDSENEEYERQKLYEKASRPGRVKDAFEYSVMEKGRKGILGGSTLFRDVQNRGRFTVSDMMSKGFFEQMMGEAKGQGLEGKTLEEFREALQRHMMITVMGSQKQGIFGHQDVRQIGMKKLASMWAKTFGVAAPGFAGTPGQPPPAAVPSVVPGATNVTIGVGESNNVAHTNAREQMVTETTHLVTIQHKSPLGAVVAQQEALKASKNQGMGG